MKKTIFKIVSLFTFLFACLFTLSTSKVYAATSSYDLATYFTFSSDMDIDEGFDLIKPFILYYDGNPCTSDYTFNYESLGNNRYRYTGTYPDGSNYSIQTTIQIIDNASGTYVEAENAEPYRQSIYVKSLNEGKTTNDCLMECWKNRWVNVTYPIYSIQDTPTMNIYNHMTSFVSGAGETHTLQYYAVIENVNYTPDEDQSDNATNNDTTPGDTTTGDTPGDNDSSLDEPIIPGDGTTDDNTPSGDTGNTDDDSSNNDNSNGVSSNTPNDSNNNSSNNNNSTNDTETEKDPLLIALFCVGGILGLVLIFLLYKVLKTVFMWLKR